MAALMGAVYHGVPVPQAGPAAPQAAAAGPPVAPATPRRIDLRVEVRPELATILVEADLTFVVSTPEREIEIGLRADLRLDTIEDVDGLPLAYRRGPGSVRVVTPPLEPGSEVRWTFRYRVRFDTSLAEGGQVLLTTPWYPHFRADHDPAEFIRYLAMPMTLTATLPRPWVLASAGTNSSRRNDDGTITYRWQDSVPSTQIPLAIAPLQERDKVMLIGVLRGFFPIEHQSLAKTFVDYMGAAATFFTEHIGPLNRRSWNLVAMRMPENISGVTVPGVTFIAARDIDPDGAFPYRVLAHEIAHHWWNHYIEIPRPRDGWLREGLPTYSALLFLEHDYGRQMMRLELERSRRVALAVDTGESLDLGFEMVTPEAIYALNYHKAAVVLHMLREVMGLDGFTRLCRRLHEHDGDINTETFVRFAEEIYGNELSWFFDAWVRNPAVPSFAVRYGFRATGDAASRYQLTGTITQSGAAIRYPVRLRIPLEAAPPLETIVWIEPGVTEFSILLPSPPRDLLFDPDGDLLFREATVERGGRLPGDEPVSAAGRERRSPRARA